MLVQVHDELIFEVPVDRAEEISQVVIAKMEGAAKLSVPLSVHIGIGKNWAEAKS